MCSSDEGPTRENDERARGCPPLGRRLVSFKEKNRVIGVSLKVFRYPSLAFAKLMESDRTSVVLHGDYHLEAAVFRDSGQTLLQCDCVA